MALICSISGIVPENPVLSKTGYVFEKHLIENYIRDSATCPVSGEPLTINDITPINVNKLTKPRSISATSIPGILSMLQSEWDALALETFNLRTHVEAVRNQLSHCLYQHDAAVRVISRLIKQRDKALEDVEILQKQLSNSTLIANEPGLDDDAIDRIGCLAADLMSQRKKRSHDNFVSADSIKKWSNSRQFRTHSSTQPGILCISLDKSNYDPFIPTKQSHVYTGGNDGIIVYFDLEKEKSVSKLLGHTKCVNCVDSHQQQSICISGSDDKTIRIWKGDDESGEFKTIYLVRKHKSPITSVNIHPIQDFFASSGRDKCCAIHDIDSGLTVQSMDDLSSNVNKLEFHPDGLIMAAGNDEGNILFWDLRTRQFKDPIKAHNAKCTSIAFSENGYYLASCGDDNVVALWDLRKSTSFQKLDLKAKPGKVVFDYSGKYLGVAVKDNVQIYNFASKASASLVSTMQGHSDIVTDITFGPGARYLLSTCLDKTMRLWE